jgi:hypothetical protein
MILDSYIIYLLDEAIEKINDGKSMYYSINIVLRCESKAESFKTDRINTCQGCSTFVW